MSVYYPKANFKDIRTQEALAVFLNQGVKGEMFEKRARTAAENEGFGAYAKRVEEFEATPEGAQRRADAKMEMAAGNRGRVMSRINVLRTEALANLTNRGEIDDPARIALEKMMEKGTFGMSGEHLQAIR